MAFKTGESEAKTEATYSSPLPEGDGAGVRKSDVEVPYTEYQSEHKIPFTAKYLNIESVWNEDQVSDDVEEIEDYVRELVNKGELENDTKIVEKKLKSIEKMANIDSLEGYGNRLIKLASFVKYLKLLERRQNERHI